MTAWLRLCCSKYRPGFVSLTPFPRTRTCLADRSLFSANLSGTSIRRGLNTKKASVKKDDTMYAARVRGTMYTTKGINLFINGTVLCFVAVGVFAFYKTYTRKQRFRGTFTEIPQSTLFKDSLHLVRYKETILSEDMILDGTMDRVASFQARPSDIFVASFPKSGTTWLQEVVYRLTHNNEDSEEWMETRFPYLEFPYPGINDIQNRPGMRLIKTHLPRHLLPPTVQESNSKLIYIYRNPKDVAVSYFHFARLLTFVGYIGSFLTFVQFFTSDLLPYSPYFPHLEAYIQWSKDDPEHILSLAYEDMMENPAREIRKIAKFLQIEATDEFLRGVQEKTTFKAMKSNPATNYQHWTSLGLAMPKREPFMRKGIVGDSVNHFDNRYAREFMDEYIKQGTESTGLSFKFELNQNNGKPQKS